MQTLIRNIQKDAFEGLLVPIKTLRGWGEKYCKPQEESSSLKN
jgi:hypothetical protein